MNSRLVSLLEEKSLGSDGRKTRMDSQIHCITILHLWSSVAPWRQYSQSTSWWNCLCPSTTTSGRYYLWDHGWCHQARRIPRRAFDPRTNGRTHVESELVHKTNRPGSKSIARTAVKRIIDQVNLAMLANDNTQSCQCQRCVSLVEKHISES